MSFDPRLWTRLEHDGYPIWVRPDKPDWFVPNRAGDELLQGIGRSGANGLDLRQRRFLARLPDDPPRSYEGRHDLLRTEHLRELWFHITDTCNLTCDHCLVSSSPQATAMLPAARIAEIAGQATELGCRIFALTGGEPFGHRDFESIVDGLLAGGETQVVVLTNGSLLDRHAAALERWPAERFHLQISVDGLPRSHERVRGERTFDKLVTQLRGLKSRGFPFTVSMCVMEHNRAEMAEVVDFAAGIGATNVHFLWYFVRGRGEADAATLPADLFAHLEQAARSARSHGIAIDNIEACRSQVFAPSGTLHDGSSSGWESLAVGPDGKLYPSPALVGIPSLGTSVNGDLGGSWRGSPTLESLRRSTAARSASPLRFLVGGGDSDHKYVHSGGFDGDDPFVPLYEQIALSLIANEAAPQSDDGPPALRLKMGDVLAACGESGEVALTHSNCLLAVASQDQVRSVKEFYAEAEASPAEEIRNPVCYPEEWTSHIPADCLVRSYGCGSPVLDAEIGPAERVVDLGSGTGVECLIASKIVGAEGSVVGIDMLDPMIERARKGASAAAANLGYANVRFCKAYLETLPLEDGSVDVVLSNCVINLSHHKRRTFAEVHRILAEGGRLVVSDVVCETEPSSAIRNNETLRGECIGGALTQRDLVGLLEEAGFGSFRVLKRFPYRVVQGHPFFSLTFAVTKAPSVPRRRVLYRGPFAAVLTADGDLLTPGTVATIRTPASIDPSLDWFELDDEGRVTNADLGGSACCTPAPAASAGCCGSEPAAAVEQEPAAAGCCGGEPSKEAEQGEESRPAGRRHARGCMSCGAPLEYVVEERERACVFCGKPERSTAFCANGHFVCDRCHAESGLEAIERICLATRETDMLSLLWEIRADAAIPLHGPEHHALVPGVILATYRNLGGEIGERQIRTGIRRGSKVPGGSCGTMGACGAGVGVGTAFGVILESTPLAARARATVLKVTGRVLGAIGEIEAPRCCQRECFVALQQAAELSRELLPLPLKASEARACAQMGLNTECIGPDCPLFAPDE